MRLAICCQWQQYHTNVVDLIIRIEYYRVSCIRITTVLPRTEPTFTLFPISTTGTKDTFIINLVCDQKATPPSLKLILEELGTSTHVTHNVFFELSTALACEPAPVDCQITGKPSHAPFTNQNMLLKSAWNGSSENLSYCNVYPSETAFLIRINVGWDLILSMGNLLDGCGLLLVDVR